MIVITGAAGFIGSNLVKAFNQIGSYDIVAIDNLENGSKIHNLSDCIVSDFLDPNDLRSLHDYDISHVFHLGACSATDEWNGKFLLENNFTFSKSILEIALKKSAKFVYASSASVYGLGINGFKEVPECERPINAYAYSKKIFDDFVRIKHRDSKNIFGLRYFNVYGKNEDHKGHMASPVHKFYEQLINYGSINLFSGTEALTSDKFVRDFISVEDCVRVKLHLMDYEGPTAIFNVGTGKVASFESIANMLIKLNGSGKIEYIDFPKKLEKSYQFYTCADINNLRNTGFSHDFISLREGVNKFYNDQTKLRKN